jgi:hypothetical protein
MMGVPPLPLNCRIVRKLLKIKGRILRFGATGAREGKKLRLTSRFWKEARRARLLA